MAKNLLIAACAFASAVFAFDNAACLVPIDDTGTSLASTTYVHTPSGCRDVIYDDQTYDYDYCYNGLSIYGAINYESADDFIPEDDVTINEIVIWLSGQNVDLRCDWFEGSSSGPGDDPPADFFNEEISSGDITWEDTGDYFYGYPIIKTTVPISDCELSDGDYYWLGFQNTTGSNTFWWAFDYGTMGGPHWEQAYFYYVSYWTPAGSGIFEEYELFYELHGTLTDYEDPDVTETYPHDSDFPSGVPVDTNVTFHVTDDSSGCDVEETTISVEQGGDQLLGIVTWDDADPLDVAFEWEPDGYYAEGADVDVAVETYDLAGNGPVTENWSFTTGYVNVAPASLGAIKAGFAE